MSSLVFFGSLWVMSVFLIFSGLILMGLGFSIECFVSWFNFYVLNYLNSCCLMLMVVVLMLIYSMVLVFSMLYMCFEKLNYSFLASVNLFVLGMVLFLVFYDWYMVLIGWEILGVVSFLLIFYYSNSVSKVSSMYTLMINRFGDLGLILYFVLWFMGALGNTFYLDQGLFLLICLLSKSAQFPLSVWLPMAMSAPTPVSSLVHSSTLVTAGVFVYLFVLSWLSSWNLFVVMWFGGFTIFIGGVSSLFEKDAKKIVALSTLFHLGLLVVLMVIINDMVVYFHLFFHGFFKSLLFVGVGLLIFSLNHNQDVRVFWGKVKVSGVYYSILVVSVFSLIGLPYFSGSYGKEVFIYSFEGSSVYLVVFLVVILSLACSFSYSMGLMSGVWQIRLGASGGFVVMGVLLLLVLFIGIVSMMGWSFFDRFFVSVVVGYSSFFSIILFWVSSLFIYLIFCVEGVSIVLTDLLCMYKIFIKGVLLIVIKIMVEVEDLIMSLPLVGLVNGFNMFKILHLIWFSYFSLFLMGLSAFCLLFLF